MGLQCDGQAHEGHAELLDFVTNNIEVVVRYFLALLAHPKQVRFPPCSLAGTCASALRAVALWRTV